VNKGQLSKLLRSLGLIYLFDWSRYYYHWIRNRSKNNAFKKAHPGLALPPDYLIYESFQMDYKKYYTDSRETAFWIHEMVNDHLHLNPGDRILDWGCGPGRIIRHMPEVFGKEIDFFGTDINPRSIAWCTENLTNIQFNLNGLEAELPYPDQHFSFIWGISIFTHLSEKMHYEWMRELKRILRPGGVLFLTTHGNNFKSIMTTEEIEAFESGKLLERAQTTEGHRTYSAFQPPSFMHALFNGMEICTHLEREPSGSGIIPQDVWVVKK
jgi:ubiquinone/menaquinone biosynthesis C-methylase UbiE